MPKQLKEYSIGELKALAYDLLIKRDQTNQNLQAVNQLIAEKQNAKQEPTKEKKEEKRG